MSSGLSALLAEELVAAVRDSPAKRYRFAARFYQEPLGEDRSRYGRAELSFLRWEIKRGVLNPLTAVNPGSAWWRALNERLLRDKTEAALLMKGVAGTPSHRSVELWMEFLRTPTGAGWYRAHNASIVNGYLEYESLAAQETPAERFMMNVALLRVIYVHVLAAEPRLALGRFASLGRRVSDPRGGFVGFFLELDRAFPERYPLAEISVESLLTAGRPLVRALDYGLIGSRLSTLYRFTAASLEQPAVTLLIQDGIPCYAWPATERSVWLEGITRPLPRLLAFTTGAGRDGPLSFPLLDRAPVPCSA